MNNVLVVGGAGYIGGYLVDLMLDMSCFDVTVYDSLLYEDRFLKDVNFIRGDIRDYEKLDKILDDFDVVVWLAAIVGDGACAVDPELTKTINTDTVKWLGDRFKGKIVFTSTCSVYGVNNGLIKEDAEPNPLSVYAETKLEAEEYLRINNPDSLIFRLGTLYGVSDLHSRIRLDLVANVLTMKGARGEKLSVFGGEQWRPLLHVRDVSTAIVHGLRHDLCGLYNLSDENYTIGQLAQEISEHLGGVEIEYTDMKFEDMRNYRVSSDKYADTGWEPHWDLGDGVAEVADIIIEERITDVYNPIYHNQKYLQKEGIS